MKKKTETQIENVPANEPVDHNLNLLTLNDRERAPTFEDIEDEKWNYLNGALKRKQILSGTICGLEHRDSRYPVCVVDYDGLRIAIPIKEMFIEQWDDVQSQNEYIVRVNRSLGATIDFVLKAVDVHSHAAVGSRRNAMLERQARFYQTGRIKPGILIACRVISVGTSSLTVEAAGVDSLIPIREVGWRWYQNVSDVYSPGDLVTAKVLSVTQNEDNESYQVSLSIREATEGNPDLPALRRLVMNSTYFGTVTGVNDGVIYIRLQAGVNAKARGFFSEQKPAKYDTVSFQVRRIEESNCVALGVVTRIIKRYANAR